MWVTRGLGIAFAAACCSLAVTARADAAITSVFTNTATPVRCAVQPDGVRLCSEAATGSPRSTVKTFDGVPIDVDAAFPPAPATGPDGPYPLIMIFQPWASPKATLKRMQPWLNRGYAAFSMTPRGFGESCGTSAARAADPAGCASGYVRLLDTRYEVRDAQELVGLLADEGHVDGQRLGATGRSYGGAPALALAVLNDRKMLPSGALVPWTSPAGTPLRIAAAAPELTWTDLAYSLVPNGSTLDYVADAPYLGRTGVVKQWEHTLYSEGLSYFYAPVGADPDADFTAWDADLNAGEPYDDSQGDPFPAIADIRDEVTTHHSAYYIDHSEPPAPLLISNGWTDDLFPADEAVRFYNRTRTQFPTIPIALSFMDYGHVTGRPKVADRAVLDRRQYAWMDYYVKGAGVPPFGGVEALTQTCPDNVPSGGPYRADTWAAIAPGEVRIDGGAQQRIEVDAGTGWAGTGPCATAPATDEQGTATYQSAAVPDGGYTLMGSPTVVADFTTSGTTSQVAARLLDVDPAAGTEALVARGLWRPAIASGPERQVFQLHPNGYRFAPGHVVKLELLPHDSPYGRASNGQQPVRVAQLQLRLPVVEAPGALGGLVSEPAPRVVPPGYTLARDFGPATFVRPKGAGPMRLSLVPAFAPCTSPDSVHGEPLSFGSCGSPAPVSPYVTIGSPDANGLEASSVGLVRLEVVAGNPDTSADEADVLVTASLTDARQASDLTDYTGELEARLGVRITDFANGTSGSEAATVEDTSLSVPVPCAETPDPTSGGSCEAATSLDAQVPGIVPEGKRSLWQLDDVRVFDGGSDGLASTTAGNVLFARQGVFVP